MAFGKISGKRGETAQTELKNWYKDRYQAAVVWRNILAIIAMLSVGFGVVAVFTVKSLAPLKTVDPFVIQIDEKTGITQVVDPLKKQELSADTALNNYFLVQYIRARESYEPALFQYHQNVVRLMSEPSRVYGVYRQSLSTDNPNSPLVRLQGGNRTVKIKSISYLDPKKVLVKVTIYETTGSGTTEIHKIALLEFQYVSIELSPEERYINPLGFLVTNYRLDDDTYQ